MRFGIGEEDIFLAATEVEHDGERRRRHDHHGGGNVRDGQPEEDQEHDPHAEPDDERMEGRNARDEQIAASRGITFRTGPCDSMAPA